MNARIGAALVAAALGLVGCDADEKTDPPTNPEPPVAARPEAEPYELVDFALRRPTDAGGFEALFTPLLSGSGTARLAEGVTLEVETDPSTAERRVVTIRMALVGEDESETLLRAPMSAAYLELFVGASVEGLTAAATVDPPAPFETTYEVRSPNGGALSFIVSPGMLQARLRSSATSLAPGRVYAPIPDGDAHEVVSAQVRFGMDYLTFRGLLLTAFDPAASGVAGDVCGELNAYGLSAPHDWYDLCVHADDLTQPVQVDVDLLTKDGRKLPIARSPAGLRSALMWLTALDRIAAAALPDSGDAEITSTAFDYRDPAVQGGSVFTASNEGGKIVFDHRSITPPSSLPDVAPVARPVPRPLPTLPDDPCVEAGSELAPKGRIIVDAMLDERFASITGVDLPLMGVVRASIYRAEDVTIAGPRADATALDTFDIEDIGLRTDSASGRYVSPELRAGTYMVLGFFDVDGDADADDPQPKAGEPVSLPLRRVELQCAEQPTTLLFDAPFPG